MSSSRPRGSSRRFNFRLIALLFVAVAVFLGVILAVGTLTRSYTAIIATQVIEAGAPFADGQYQVVHVNGDAPVLDGASSSRVLTDADLDTFRGKLLTNTVYPGSLLQTGDFFIPAAFDPTKPDQSYATHFTELLGENQRGLLVAGDPTSTFVQVGDYVDVIWLPNYQELNAAAAQAAGQTDTSTIVGPYTDSAQRLFTKRVIYAVPVPAPNSADGNPADQSQGTIFVLDLTAQESQDLVWAEANGTLRITLASPESVNNPGTQVTTPDYFNNTYKIIVGATPAPTPTPEPSVEPSATPESSVPALPSPTQ